MRRLSDLERVAPAMLPYRSETVRPVDWELLESTLGVALPSDYREFCDHYPQVVFDDFMYIRVAYPGNEEGYVRGVLSLSEEMDGHREDGMTEDYSFYPEPEGLICCGASYLGDYFFWRTSGPDPDRWPAVVFTGDSWWEHEGGLVSLFVGAIDGSVQPWITPPVPGPNPTVGVMGPPARYPDR